MLSLPECIDAMERAFRMRAEGRVLAPSLMHVEAGGGHTKPDIHHMMCTVSRMKKTGMVTRAQIVVTAVITAT